MVARGIRWATHSGLRTGSQWAPTDKPLNILYGWVSGYPLTSHVQVHWKSVEKAAFSGHGSVGAR